MKYTNSFKQESNQILMTSINFLIGERLSLEGFDYYVKPYLNKHAEISGYGFLKSGKHPQGIILVSLKCENGEDLEDILRKSLNEAVQLIEEDFNNSTHDIFKLKAWTYHLKKRQGNELKPIFERVV